MERYTYDAYGLVEMHGGSGQTISACAYGNPYFFTGRWLDRHDSNLAIARLDLYHYRTCIRDV